MTETKSDTLRVPGAALYYQRQGAGPLLLILQGGGGDANASDGIARHLADRYTVLSYDRRGLSRSRLDAAAESQTPETHSDDVYRLLTALTTEPVFVFGASIGALIGLDLVSRHPECVRQLVAHEPPATELLPEPVRTQARQAQADAEEAYRREGAPGAMRQFMIMTGVNYEDREPDVERPQPTPGTIDNAEFFLAHDAPAAHRYRPDLARLKAAAAKIVPAAGRGTRGLWIHQCVEALASEIGAEVVEFPGGHAGFASHPKGFAAELDGILSGRTAASM